jgi:hypothetical protein
MDPIQYLAARGTIDGLAWSALPHAPVVDAPAPARPRAAVARARAATALHRLADAVAPPRPADCSYARG